MSSMDDYTKQDLLNYVAPCSLLCYTCPGYKDGVIADHAAKLCNYFKGYYEFNDKHLPDQYRAWLPEFKNFYNKLESYSKRSCPGCRNCNSKGFGCLEGCFLLSCSQEHVVSYCGECNEFPCAKALSFFSKNQTLLSGWLYGSSRIKESGVMQYFLEKKDVSHYIDYEKGAGAK